MFFLKDMLINDLRVCLRNILKTFLRCLSEKIDDILEKIGSITFSV